MTHWLRFEHENQSGFGSLEAGIITVCEGDLFTDPIPTGQTLAMSEVRLLTPSQASKMIGLWNNYHELADKLG